MGSIAGKDIDMTVAIESTVVECVRQVCAHNDLACEVSTNSSLVDTLGLDSLRFVDLTVSLEDALGIEAFPMQAWVDRQHATEPPRFRVIDLVRECERIIAGCGASQSCAEDTHVD